jgi:hypothetical protein
VLSPGEKTLAWSKSLSAKPNHRFIICDEVMARNEINLAHMDIPPLALERGASPLSSIPRLDDSQVEVWRDGQGSFLAYCYANKEVAWIEWPEVANFRFDKQTGRVVAFPTPFAKTELIEDVYRRTIVPVVLQALGIEVLHASAIATPDGIVAFCAKSGTGKSTLSYALHQRGYQLWADDAVALEITDARVSSFFLPFAMKLRPEAKAFFGVEVAPAFPLFPKIESAIEKSVPAQIAKLVILHRVQPGETVSARPLSSVQAFATLLPHAYCFSLRDRGRKQVMMQNYLDLVARVPVFELCIEAGMDKLPMILNCIERDIL